MHVDSKGFFDESFREEYMKPGFENFEKYTEVKPSVDVDLDGEIYADQLHSLLQRISPELESMRAKALAPKQPQPKRKVSDEEKIMDQIHCIDEEEKRAGVHPFKKHEYPPNIRIPHYGGAFEGVIDGPKTHRQTFSYQMVRKPEGTYTTSTVVDPSGNTKTVIKRTVDGETKTQTLINGIDVDEKNGGVGGGSITDMVKKSDWIINCGRHFYVNKDGYALPKNLWWLEIWKLSIQSIASIYYHALVVVVILLCLSNNSNQNINTTTITTNTINLNPNNSTSCCGRRRRRFHHGNNSSCSNSSSKNIKDSQSQLANRLGNESTFMHVMYITKIRWKQLFIKFSLKFDYLKFDHNYDFR